MRFKPELFAEFFSDYQIPDWKCPTCQIGTLINASERFDINELAESRQVSEHIAIEDSELKFMGNLRCTNIKCKEIVSIAGKANLVQEDYDYNEELNEYFPAYSFHFYPHYFYPSLKLFEYPEKLPKVLEMPLENVFKLFWLHKAACANAIRVAVEEILNSIGIGSARTLHDRLLLMEKKKKKEAKYLMAVKWIGNEGSHNINLPHKDLLDGIKILCEVLHLLYSDYHKEIAKKVKTINKKKGI